MRTNSPAPHAFLLGKPPYLAPPGLNTGGCRPIACGNTGSGYGYFAIAQYAYAKPKNRHTEAANTRAPYTSASSSAWNFV